MATPATSTDRGSQVNVVSGYAPVNGLQMYYEIHGERRGEEPPLVLLHGGPTTITTSFGLMLPTLTGTRQIIAIEQQGHGHTADIDRPMSYEQMAEDTAALLKHLRIVGADVLGFSDGGVVGLGLAMRHPSLVRKLVAAGANYNVDGLYPEIVTFLKNAGPDDFGQLRDAYLAIAPRPEDWPTLVSKAMKMGVEFRGWPEDGLRSIQAPVLVVVGDGDMVRPEHAVALFRLLPHAKLAVLPDTDHVALVKRPERLLAVSLDFLDAPMPDGTSD
jgi:pimeloyl-ACP methyl ester carboxylesterase